MSEAERKKRLGYRKTRKRWITVQTIILTILILLTLALASLSVAFNKTYYINYDETSAVDYGVHLKDNEFYEDSFLGKDYTYIAALIDKVEARFDYGVTMKTDEDIDFDYKYKVDAVIEIKEKNSGRIMFAPVYNEVAEKSGSVSGKDVNISQSLLVDYNKYNNIAESFINTYQLSYVTASLVLKMDVSVNGKSEEFSANENTNNYISAISIPLSSDTVEVKITSNIPKTNEGILSYTTKDTSELFRNHAYKVGGVSLFVAIILLAYIFLSRNIDITHEIRVKRILSAYRSFIQRLKNEFDTTGYQPLYLSTFNEMLEIRDTIGSPVLMFENEDKTLATFLIPTNTKIVYVFEMKVDDYDEIYGKGPEGPTPPAPPDGNPPRDNIPQTPAIEETPTVEEALPVVEQPTATEEVVVEEAPVVEEPQAIEEPTVVEEAPTIEEIPAIEEPQEPEEPEVVEEALTIEEIPAIEEPQVPKEPEVVEEALTIEEAPLVEEIPECEEPIIAVEEIPAIDEPQAPEEPEVVEEALTIEEIIEGPATENEDELLASEPQENEEQSNALPIPLDNIIETESEDGESSSLSYIDDRGAVITIACTRSFTANLIQSNPQIKDYYNKIKNRILSYKGVKARTSWRNESYKKGRIQLFKLKIRGKTICLYCALNPDEFDKSKYFHEVSEAKNFAGVPMMVRIKSDRGLKRALTLVDMVMAKFDIPLNPRASAVDFTEAFPYDTTKNLVERQLIKLLFTGAVAAEPKPYHHIHKRTVEIAHDNVVDEIIIHECDEQITEEALMEIVEEPTPVLDEIDFDEASEPTEEYIETPAHPGVDVIGVVWPEKTKRNKIYRYDPDGEIVSVGDIVIVPTYDIHRNREVVRKAAVAHANHKVDPDELKFPIKKIIGVIHTRPREETEIK